MSLASSIIAPHVEFSTLDAEKTVLIKFCRVVLGAYSGIEFSSSIALMVILQSFWESDLCTYNSAYISSNSVVCEIGLPLYIFATFGISLLIIMSALGIYGAYSVRRLFISIYLSLSIGLVLFLMFMVTLVIVVEVRFDLFGIFPTLFLAFSFVPVVTCVLLLRHKSTDPAEVLPSATMMETVLSFPHVRSDSPHTDAASMLLSYDRVDGRIDETGNTDRDFPLLQAPIPIRPTQTLPVTMTTEPPRRPALQDEDFMKFL